MKALVVTTIAADFAGCDVQDLAVPRPGPEEVRVRVRAAGVNFPDLLQTRGEYQHKPDLPFVPGLEVAGEVDAVGTAVQDLQVGDAVVGPPRGGGFCEFSIAAARDLRRKPQRLTFSEAAAFGTAYLTAYVALVRCAQLQAHEWLLVHGAAGGVGLAAVDLGKALGARVIAASTSAEKIAIVDGAYRPHAALAAASGFRSAVKDLTDGRGADVVFDPVGGDVFDESVRCMAFGGRLLSVGFAGGRIPALPVNLALIKGFSVIGVRAGEYGRRFPDRGRENLDAIWSLAEAGRLRPRVYREYSLARWREAFEAVEGRQVVGKAVIRPDL